MINLYKIMADYRPKNSNRPTYYIAASSKKEAKEEFSKTITWLKIYGCEEITDEAQIDEIISNRKKYQLFRRELIVHRKELMCH